MQRRAAISQLNIPFDEAISQWLQEAICKIDQRIEAERGREQITEQSFE